MILVTGGEGFLGRHVVAELKARGHSDVFAARHYDFNLCYASDAVLLMAKQPDTVIHLAAHVGGIGLNQARPADLFRDNMLMGLNMLDQCAVFGVEKLVMVGTVCAYPKYAPVPFREENLWEGYPEKTNAAYGIAKRALLVAGQAYRQQYGLNVIHLIPTNLYGPGDRFDLDTSHVIPALIRKCVEAKKGGEAVTLWGDGSPTRDFLYVEDAAEAIVTATEKYDDAEPVNLGSGREVSIAALAQMVARLVGFVGSITWDRTKPNGQPRRAVNSSRAFDEFGWKAKTQLEDGLRATVEWYLAQQGK